MHRAIYRKLRNCRIVRLPIRLDILYDDIAFAIRFGQITFSALGLNHYRNVTSLFRLYHQLNVGEIWTLTTLLARELLHRLPDFMINRGILR